jgi:hypothetical protein
MPFDKICRDNKPFGNGCISPFLTLFQYFPWYNRGSSICVRASICWAAPPQISPKQRQIAPRVVAVWTLSAEFASGAYCASGCRGVPCLLDRLWDRQAEPDMRMRGHCAPYPLHGSTSQRNESNHLGVAESKHLVLMRCSCRGSLTWPVLIRNNQTFSS